MVAFRGIRLGLEALLAVFSIIVLGIAAHLINISVATPNWLGYTLAVSIITCLVLIVIFVVDLLGIGLFFVVAELIWTFILMILWVAAAGAITDALPPGGCISAIGFCGELQALDAFAWLSWITILAWFITLLVLSFMAHSRGNRGVWRQHVNDTTYNGHGSTTTGHMSQRV